MEEKKLQTVYFSSETIEKIELAPYYDLYKMLLSQQSREMMEDYLYGDFSFSEIALQRQSSRQAVYDQLKRSKKKLMQYEAALHLKEQMDAVRLSIEQIQQDIAEIKQIKSLPEILQRLEKIEQISQKLIEGQEKKRGI